MFLVDGTLKYANIDEQESMTRRQAETCEKRIRESMSNMKLRDLELELKIERWSHSTMPMQKVTGMMSATGLDEK